MNIVVFVNDVLDLRHGDLSTMNKPRATPSMEEADGDDEAWVLLTLRFPCLPCPLRVCLYLLDFDAEIVFLSDKEMKKVFTYKKRKKKTKKERKRRYIYIEKRNKEDGGQHVIVSGQKWVVLNLN